MNLKSQQSKYFAYQQASLSQKVSFNTPILQKLAGSDMDISDSIAILSYVNDPENMKLLAKDVIKWTIGLLDILRLSHFSTSKDTDILTKLGFMSPKAEDIISSFEKEA